MYMSASDPKRTYCGLQLDLYHEAHRDLRGRMDRIVLKAAQWTSDRAIAYLPK
jgi:hypothetical protein